MNINPSLRDVEIENIIWVIYLFIIGANFVSNYYVEKYAYTHDEKNRKIFRYINITVLSIILLIYIYYVHTSYNNMKKDTLNSIYKKCIFAASIFVLIGGIIYLMVEFYKNNNPEVALF